jgi:hypothetical protein
MTTCFRNGTMDELAAGEFETESDVQLEVSMELRGLAQNLAEDTSRTCFQVDLGSSRVYKRTELYESDVSFTSSVARTHAWSIFSDLSLSEVSMISAIALPLYLNEISNKQWYTFGRLNETFLHVPSQNMNTSSPSDSPADRATNIASGDRLDQRLQTTAKRTSKKPRSSLFSRLNLFPPIQQPERVPLNRDLSNDSASPESRTSPITNKPDSEPEPPAASISNRSLPYVSTGAAGKMVLYKLVVLGDKGVGKTKLTIQVNFLI